MVRHDPSVSNIPAGASSFASVSTRKSALCHAHNALLLALALPALRAALDAARLIPARRSARGLGLLDLLQVVLRDPLLLVPARARRGDVADGGADLRRGLALLGLRRERDVGVVAGEAEEASDDEVRGDAGRREALGGRKYGGGMGTYSLKSKNEDSGSTT